MYSAAGDRADGSRPSASSTPATCSTPACSSTRRRSTPTCGSPRRQRPVRTTLRLTHDDGSSPRRCTAAPASASASPTTPASGGVMCPSYLATREEKDSTRGRARVLQDVVNGDCSASTTPRVERGARPVPVVQGLRPRLPDRHRHGDLQVRGPLPEVPAQGCGRARHYALGQLPRWARLTPPRLANAMLRSRTVARLAKAAAGVDQRRQPAPVLASAPLAARATRRSPRTSTSWIWADSFTDRFAADTGRAAIELLETDGAARGGHPRARRAAG